MATEIFRTNWRGWASSSEGYAVRIVGRNDLQYRDESGIHHIFIEPMTKWTEIVVDTEAIPRSPLLPEGELLNRLRRVFAFRGWTLIESGG
ncbi:hypothetical protein Back2_05110 [Nocardioides baekrokdamisoli]|uniref:Uncharacterized protein n=1 Tax=Nocardioides baekrokdamisoli TaxID=1804624 RepID=A0A3G9IYH9_9ACTN|nr:hypothetical protein [Nocardioides baekrokdamisoli]BBH16224.1 hypothetical protein Back2_05110 [Nocardioides baekrokdamisoli]